MEKKIKGKGKTGKRRLEDRQKDEIWRLLEEGFKKDPGPLWSWSPAIADKLEQYVVGKKQPLGRERPFYSYLTERERDFRLKALSTIVEKFEGTGNISKEEAIKALEDAAALREHSAAYKGALLALLKAPLGFPFDATKEKTVPFQRGKAEHHTYTLARGITLSLTWDGKLIKITFDPKEFAIRQRALSFIGIGHDPDPDVGRRHDDYAWGEPGNE